MTTVSPCSISNILLFPGTTLAVGKANCSTRCNLLRKSSKCTPCFERFVLLPSASVSLFSQYRRRCALHHKQHIISCMGTDSAWEEEEETSDESSDESDEDSSSAPAWALRNVKKSKMPPVKNEDLIVGATFTGRVTSIQPYGVFVDIGAFTRGMVHLSRLSDSFVEDAESVVSVGQEVKVRLVEVNFGTKRIVLSMRKGDDFSKPILQRDGSGTPRKGLPSWFTQKKTSQFVVGEKLVGTVKKLTGYGAIISLPGEEQGFLPQAEGNIGLARLMKGTSLEVGEEVNVQVLDINPRGHVTLRMKEDDDDEEEKYEATSDTYIDSTDGYIDITDGEEHVPISPFKLAFSEIFDTAKSSEERKKQQRD